MSMTKEERRLFDTLVQKVEKQAQEKNNLKNRLDDHRAVIDRLKHIKDRFKLALTISGFLSFVIAFLALSHDYIMRLLQGTKYFSFAQSYSIGSKQLFGIAGFAVAGVVLLWLGRK